MLHYANKTNKPICRYVNLLKYDYHKPPKYFGHLLWPSSYNTSLKMAIEGG